MANFFISDLHLSKERPEINQLLFRFLQHRLTPGDTLYILGDLFEAWLGDDAIPPEYEPVLLQLKNTVERGIKILFMHGNRDFLIGEEFAKKTGCELLDDPYVITLDNERVLLMHGDTLCTDDTEYQAYRAYVRSPRFLQQVEKLSIEERLFLADSLRLESEQQTQNKIHEIMDVNQGAVVEAMKRHHVKTLIHGHTHRPAIHDVRLNKENGQRIVLGDWYQQGSVLVVNDSGYDLNTIGLDTLTESATI